jgi:hypothetical protein
MWAGIQVQLLDIYSFPLSTILSENYVSFQDPNSSVFLTE